MVAPDHMGDENASSLDNNNTLESTYTSLIQQYLEVFMIDNAIFMAERMVATCSTSSAYYLLALCHYRAGSPQRTSMILEGIQNELTAEMRYLLAKSYYDLERYGPAEDALLKECRNDFRKSQTYQDMDTWILSTTPCPVPNGAAGLHLLGDICRHSNRKERAIYYYRVSLKLDPMMWTSYESLCEMGDDELDPTTVFGVACPAATAVEVNNEPPVPEEPQGVAHHHHEQQERGVLTPSFTLSQTPAPVEMTPMMTRTRSSKAKPGTAVKPSLFETPNLTPIPVNETQKSGVTNPQVLKRARKVASRLYYPPSPASSHGCPRSLFLSGLENSGVPEDLLETPGDTTARNRVQSQKKQQPKVEKQQPQDTTRADDSNNDNKEVGKENQDQSVQEILELLCVLGAAHKRLCRYQCAEALRIFHYLPQQHFHTGWVLHQVGRAYFEMADYQNAQRHLELMQQVEPHRMKGLEVLSTTLWHLKKEVELAHLAQRAVDFDRKCPECWCVVGNCFSLQKEHETALTFFRRSIQLDPSFTYPHTLSGHEYAAIEDFDKAVSCYRDAIRADERHYNAWYGLGALYYRQEKYDLAEYHFQRALSINSQSSVLHCHLGMAQHANGKPYQALDTLREAFRLDPRNPQARYQRATIYMAMDRPHEALGELEKVRDAAPREATIHFAMGRVLKRVGRPEQAMRSFLIALDLDPKDANLIKAAMEKMDEPDVDEEVSATW